MTIEVISRRMMRWVRIEDVGDTEFLIDEQTDKFRYVRSSALHFENARTFLTVRQTEILHAYLVAVLVRGLTLRNQPSIDRRWSRAH